jgi:peptidoglycan/xylan/chitin deacetylase (PgdA/CDA1 family)
MMRRRGPAALALTYHGVADVPLRDDPYRLFVRPAEIRRHVRTLRSWGYTLTTFGELARRAAAGRHRGYAALTFDDGLADNLSALVPVLTELGAPATVFVVSGWLAGDYPTAPGHRMLTEAELRSLAEHAEIGAHTVTHPDLTTLSAGEQLHELRASKEQLEAIVERPVGAAAYPYGRCSPTTREACRLAGFEAACLTAGAGTWSDALQLPRQAMNNRDTLVGLWLKRHGRYEQVMEPVRPHLSRPLVGRMIGGVRRVRALAEKVRAASY